MKKKLKTIFNICYGIYLLVCMCYGVYTSTAWITEKVLDWVANKFITKNDIEIDMDETYEADYE